MKQAGALRLIDWRNIRRCLMHGDNHYRPWEIRRLSMPEIAEALDAPDGKRKPPNGGQDMGANGFEEYAERFRSMTPAERLAAFERQRR